MNTTVKTELRWLICLRDLESYRGLHQRIYYLKCNNAHSVRRASAPRVVRRKWGLRSSDFGAWSFDSLADAKRTAKNCVAIKDRQKRAEKHGLGFFVEIIEIERDARTHKTISQQGVHWIGCPPLMVLALQGTKHG